MSKWTDVRDNLVDALHVDDVRQAACHEHDFERNRAGR